MELRSTRKRLDSVEYNELQVSLSEFGCYESDMELQEMRHLMAALKASMGCAEIGSNEKQRMASSLALEVHNQRQTIADFEENEIMNLSASLEVHNSTMIIPNAGNHLPFSSPSSSSCAACDLPSTNPASTSHYNNFYLRCSSSPFSSPEVPAAELTIRAEIHHEHDWSPPASPSSPPLPSPSSSLSWRNCYHSSAVSSEKPPVALAGPNRKRSTINDLTYAATTTSATALLVIDNKRMRLEDVSTFSSSSSTFNSSCATASVSASNLLPEESSDSGIGSSFSNAIINEHLDCCCCVSLRKQTRSCQFGTVSGTDCNHDGNHASYDIHEIDLDKKLKDERESENAA